MSRLFLLLAFVLALPAAAQPTYIDLAMRHAGVRPYVEAFALPTAEGAALVVPFRLPNPLLVFVADGAAGFAAEAEVTVEVYRAGRLAASERWRGRQTAGAFAETQDAARDLRGAVRFDLPPGVYGYRVVTADAQSERERHTPLRRVEVPDYDAGALGAPLMAEAPPTEADGAVAVSLTGLGGDAAHAAPGYAAVPVTLPAGADLEAATLRWAIRPRGEAPEASRDADGVPGPPAPSAEPAVRAGEIDGAAFVPVSALPVEMPAPGRVEWAPCGEAAGAYLAFVDVGGLADGAYVLDVAFATGGGVRTLRTAFETHWRGRPYALYDAYAALRVLRFIEPEDTVRSLLRGDAEARRARLASYWHERDPTPGTPHNELMAEYYRRVDHAASAFRTGTYPFPDGLKTDRARVYVVHGPPAEVRRVLSDAGGVEEVWAYPGGRRFVFRAAGSMGAFELRASR